MSDNEDLLGDDLGDQSLADYNLGNEEEEQLLADDFEHVSQSQNVPGRGYRDADVANYGHTHTHRVEFPRPPSLDSYPALDSECVVPNVPVEMGPVGSLTVRNYAPYGEVPVYEHEQHGVVPPAIPAAPLESPQIVPSELPPPIIANGDNAARERFTSERPPGVQRTPQVRDIPDSLDKVYVPRAGYGARGGQRTSWRNPHYQPRPLAHPAHPYRRHNTNRGHFLQQQPQRLPFPQPRLRSSPPRIRPEPQIRLEPPQIRMEEPQPEPHLPPDIPQMLPAPPRPPYRPLSPNMERPFQPSAPFPQRPTYPQSGPPLQNPNFRLETALPRPNYPIRPPFEQRFQFPQRPNFNERPFPHPPPVREIAPNNVNHMPQVTIRQAVPMGLPPMSNAPKCEEFAPKLGNRPLEYNPREPEVRMLPVQLPTSLPPGGLAGKKVLINPHFKGNFQPPAQELATYIPTRIQKSPPLSPVYDVPYAGPVQNVDDAAERFIAEQRNALARAARAPRKYPPRTSPQRYIENTTIEIENELARGERPRPLGHDADLLRRQEEFINANRAGLRRRMRSPSPLARRSPSPRRSPPSPSPRRPRGSPPRHHGPLDEEGEYRRRLREQESMRERVLRAKEVRRKKNAVALHKQIQDRERERQNPEKSDKAVAEKAAEASERHKDQDRQQKYESAPRQQTSPSQKRNEPQKQDNQNLTPPRVSSELDTKKSLEMDTKPSNNDTKRSSDNETKKSPEVEAAKKSPERALTPPLPVAEAVKIAKIIDFDDDDLDLILDDIEGILSDEEDTGRFKEKPKKAPSPPRSKPPPPVDLRQKLPPKSSSADSKSSLLRQKIVFNEQREKKKKERTPPKRSMVTSSTNTEETLTRDNKNNTESKKEVDANTSKRPRIIFGSKELADRDADDKAPAGKPSLNSRRVVLQRKVATRAHEKLFPRCDKKDPSRPNPGIFSRAVQKAIANDNSRVVLKQQEPKIEYEMDSDIDEDTLLSDTANANLVAEVKNLPFGMTEVRLRTLAGDGVQHISVDKEDRSATITFKSTDAAESFRKKFNNKMVAASRLSVVFT